MKKEKIEVWVLVLVGILAAGFLFFTVMRYILPVILPFAIAWAVAFAVRPPALWISGKTHISERILRPCIAVFCALLGFSLLVFIIYALLEFLGGLLSDITAYKRILTVLSGFAESPVKLLGGLPDGLSEKLAEGIGAAFTALLEKLVALITGAAIALPEAIITIFVTLVAAIYFSLELEAVNGFVKSLFPEKYRVKISELRAKIFGILGKYVKSYLQIMGITFVIILVGLLILQVKSAVLIAALVAVLDLLPIIGVGAVLVPWSVFALMLGDGTLGVGLIILFLAYTVIREVLEPKIFGKSLDVHPIVSLVSLYIGYGLFGFFGMIIFTSAAALVSGLIKKNKSAKVGER